MNVIYSILRTTKYKLLLFQFILLGHGGFIERRKSDNTSLERQLLLNCSLHNCYYLSSAVFVLWLSSGISEFNLTVNRWARFTRGFLTRSYMSLNLIFSKELLSYTLKVVECLVSYLATKKIFLVGKTLIIIINRFSGQI